MPHEFRRIVFTLEELKFALQSANRMADEPFIVGELISIDVDGKNVKATTKIRDGNTYRNIELAVAGQFVFDGLIRFCIENNIMLPRKGLKSLEITRGAVALSVKLDNDAMSSQSAGPLRLHGT